MEVTNGFKGLDLIDRVPEELWMRFIASYRRQGSKPSPRKRNGKRQNGCLRKPYKYLRKRREAKGKGERKRSTQLNSKER